MFPLIIYILWLGIPIVITIIIYSDESQTISKNTSKWIRIVAIGLTIVISLLLFASFDIIKDSFGEKVIRGYQSEYILDYDEFSRPVRYANTQSNHWFGSFILWLFEWGFMILCLAIPIITWKQCTKLHDRLPEEHL